MNEKPDSAINVGKVSELESELEKSSGPPEVFSTLLTAHEVYLLRQQGYAPVKVVVGSIVYSMGVRGVLTTLKRALVRGEMRDFSHFNQVARKLALERMHTEAAAVGGTGVVGVALTTLQYGDFLEVTAMGTAVRPDPTAVSPAPEIAVGV